MGLTAEEVVVTVLDRYTTVCRWRDITFVVAMLGFYNPVPILCNWNTNLHEFFSNCAFYARIVVTRKSVSWLRISMMKLRWLHLVSSVKTLACHMVPFTNTVHKWHSTGRRDQVTEWRRGKLSGWCKSSLYRQRLQLVRFVAAVRYSFGSMTVWIFVLHAKNGTMLLNSFVLA